MSPKVTPKHKQFAQIISAYTGRYIRANRIRYAHDMGNQWAVKYGRLEFLVDLALPFKECVENIQDVEFTCWPPTHSTSMDISTARMMIR